MEFEAIALSDFVHGDITAIAGRKILHRNGENCAPHIAEELERHGLARIRRTSVANPQGKASDDGQGQPSSVSQAAPALPTKTSGVSVRGVGSQKPAR